MKGKERKGTREGKERERGKGANREHERVTIRLTERTAND